MQDWFLWLIAGILLAILEIVTPGFVLACFSFGCFAAAIAATLDFNVTVQIAAFTVMTFVIFVSARPLFIKLLGNHRREVKTNIERVVGMVGVVVEEVSNLKGWVKVEGEIWGSRSASGQTLPAGTTVRVLRVEGNKLIVTPDDLQGNSN